MRRSLVLLLCFTLGCGAKSTLWTPHLEGDASIPQRDGGVDAGTDAGPPDGGVLVVDCGRATRFTAPRRPITLEATATSADLVVDQGWALASSPAGSMPSFVPSPDPRVVALTPDLAGSYVARFTARDAGGRTASCEVEVQAVVGPPVAICPEEELLTTAGVPVTVMGDGFDDEMVVAYAWEVVEAPPGAMPALTGADMPVVQFLSSTLGRYRLRLTVVDADMAIGTCEATVRVTGPPTVVCETSSASGPTRRPLTLRARATDDVGIASRRWEVITRPSGSTATPMPPDAETTMFTPDRRGEYLLRFTAVDVEGMSASCETRVTALPSPPEVRCPATVTTPPLVPVEITATAVDDGTIVRWAWGLEMRPAGSAARPPSPADRATTRFTPDIAGVYELTVTATDDDGLSGTCRTRVEAGNIDGLRVEMFWDTDGTDEDLHLLSPTGTRWVSNDDCYYANCQRGAVLEWGAPGTADNPRLDIDDTNGFGPENINITTPQPGTYRVAVHDYRSDRRNRVTVRVYCGGSTTMPRATFGPASLNATGGRSGQDFWRVADVTITAGGCTITDLARDGVPWIAEYGSTTGMR